MTIEIEQLEFAYGRSPVLRNITAVASPGTITAVIGPNAAGKSTLLRCMIGALRPLRGQVRLDGIPAGQLSAQRVAQRIAYVPQRPAVAAAFTVRQVVELGRYALRPDSRRIDAALQRLDLAEVADRPYQQLSAGQQQRVTLARALAQLSPDGHLILDEPTSAMDLRHVAQCVRLQRELARNGATVVSAMHDLGMAASIADQIWLLDEGRLIDAGPPADVIALDRLQAVFGVGFEWGRSAAGKPRLMADLA